MPELTTLSAISTEPISVLLLRATRKPMSIPW